MPDECSYVRGARVSRELSRSLFVRTFLLGGEGWPLIDLSLFYYHPTLEVLIVIISIVIINDKECVATSLLKMEVWSLFSY